MIQTPWAVLRCKFKDDDSEPYGRQRYDDLFTSSGVGKLNMVDFFRDMSHGQLDLSGSRVFGWYTLDMNRSAYLAGLVPGLTKEEIDAVITKARNDLIALARQAASTDLINNGPFFSVVVCMNVPTDLFGGGTGAVCDDGRWAENTAGPGMSSMSPSLLGQEMGHVYGLAHSRADGSTEDYMDPWDVMSNAARFMSPHPNFTDLDLRAQPVFRLGPGLNAANMAGRGWLDESRVWGTNDESFDTSVTFGPSTAEICPAFSRLGSGNFWSSLGFKRVGTRASTGPLCWLTVLTTTNPISCQPTPASRTLWPAASSERRRLKPPMLPSSPARPGSRWSKSMPASGQPGSTRSSSRL